jgi:hypothetical protein
MTGADKGNAHGMASVVRQVIGGNHQQAITVLNAMDGAK